MIKQIFNNYNFTKLRPFCLEKIIKILIDISPEQINKIKNNIHIIWFELFKSRKQTEINKKKTKNSNIIEIQITYLGKEKTIKKKNIIIITKITTKNSQSSY